MVPRLMHGPLLAALADRPVVVLHGPRQSGKSTLVRAVASAAHPAEYVTLDRASALSAARTDPAGFLAGFTGPVAIDEIQLAPGLFPAIKESVDRDRTAGRILLTGSANALLLPGLATSLVGRMEAVPLWPLAQAEIGRRPGGIVSRLFAPAGFRNGGTAGVGRVELLRRLLAGGYPEALAQKDDARRTAWFESYVSTILQRDIRDLAQIEGLTSLPRLLGVVAARTTGLLNFADLSRTAAVPQSTLKRYLALLQGTFLVLGLPAWSRGAKGRLVRAPKLFLGDTGLLCHLLATSRRRLEEDEVLFGHVLENFVVAEFHRLAGWSSPRPRLSHYRDAGGREVDLVLESPDGDVVGVEVKAAMTPTARDFNGLRALAEAAGRRFHRGVVLYPGDSRVAFGDRLMALPLTELWS